MAGTITCGTLSDGTNSTSSTNCIQGSAKAWVNFNGTTSPGTIRAQYNVSSVTRNATGDYTVNFTTALQDANYSVVTGTGSPGGDTDIQPGCRIGSGSAGTTAPTASSVRLGIVSGAANTWKDGGIVTVSVFR